MFCWSKETLSRTDFLLKTLRKKGGLSSSVASSIRLFLGSEEHGDSGGSSELEQSSEYGAQRWSIPIWRKVRKIQHWIQQGRKHILCKHNNSCISYVFQGFLNMFGIGYAIQFAVRVLSSLSRIFKQPKQLVYTFVHKDNFSLGAFLGCFSALFRTVNCVLRQLRNEDDSLNGLLSGFIAGWSMLWYKSSSIALYLASKLVEVLYFKGIENEILPYIKCADIILYSISTGFIFHAAVLEPHNLRPAYWKFLIRMTHNRFSEMNRKLMDVFGTNASKLYPDFWPDLDPQVSQLTKPL